MKVLIVESSDPSDFYDDQLDGPSTLQLLRLFDIRCELRMVIDRAHFVKALEYAAAKDFDVIHLSCHGNVNGVGLADDTFLRWAEFARLFQRHRVQLRALVMSSCYGASAGVGRAFEAHSLRPNIIFGSTDARRYYDYSLAWAILYRLFKKKGVTRDAAQIALAHITAVVTRSFRYRRWDDSGEQYLAYPTRRSEFRVVDINELEEDVRVI